MKLKLLLATAAGAALIAGAAQAADLTVVSWGGAYTKSQVEAYQKPWMAKTGKTIVSEDYNGGLAEIRAQSEAGNVTWDIIDVELSDAVRGCDEERQQDRHGALRQEAAQGSNEHHPSPQHQWNNLRCHKPEQHRHDSAYHQEVAEFVDSQSVN